MRVRVINGPNLNLLGQRESQIYGVESLAAVEERMRDLAAELGVEVDFVQSNSEGALVDAIQECRGQRDAIIINPGGYTHTSVAIHDAIRAAEVPAIEVHVSNIHAREVPGDHDHRRRLCRDHLGMGVLSPLALRAAVELAGREG